MRARTVIGATVATIVLGSVIVRSMIRVPAVRTVEENILCQYDDV